MTSIRNSHATCTHPRDKAGRLACRKARALKVAAITELETFFTARGDTEWLMRGAARFGSYQGTDTFEAATALLDYFAASGDKARDDRRRANGYTITDSPHHIRSIILRSYS